MDCPKCSNNISYSHMLLKGLYCSKCNIDIYTLAKHITTIYDWVCYLIKYKNKVMYVGYSANLPNRLYQHTKCSGNIYSILRKPIQLCNKMLSDNNISICISPLLSEYTLYNLYKPELNLSVPINKHYRIIKDKCLIEKNDSCNSANIYHLTLANNIQKKDSNYLTKQMFSRNIGYLYSSNYINRYLINNDEYCYRWPGKCMCIVDCNTALNLELLKHPNNMDTIATIKSTFRRNKLKEREEILKEISLTAYNMYSSMKSNKVLYAYDTYYKDYCISIKKKKDLENKMNKVKQIKSDDALDTYNKDNICNIIKLRTYSDNTIKNYKSNINGVILGITKYCKTNNITFTFNNSSSFVTDCKFICEYIKNNIKPNSSVAKITAIVWMLRSMYATDNTSVDPLVIHRYLHLMNKSAEKRDDAVEELAGKLTEKEEENFLTWDKIIECRDKMEKELDTESFHDMTDFVIVSLYTYNPPTRVDYANMRVFITDEDVPSDFKDNHCIIDSSKPRFVFWKYKTAKGDEPTIVDIPHILQSILLKWLDINFTDYLLISQNQASKEFIPMKENTLSTRVRSIFKRWTGKAASINTLRHAFVSYNSRNDIFIKV